MNDSFRASRRDSGRQRLIEKKQLRRTHQRAGKIDPLSERRRASRDDRIGVLRNSEKMRTDKDALTEGLFLGASARQADVVFENIGGRLPRQASQSRCRPR